MCGIAGILSFAGVIPAQTDFGAMATMMRRRGPDDEGYVFLRRPPGTKAIVLGGSDTPGDIFDTDFPYSPSGNLAGTFPKNSFLGLVHRRLAVLDLSHAGHQPMCTDDGRYWIVYNGEVYNFREIRDELRSLGESFSSETDTEVIIKAYRRWGPGCLDRFNGMWAFAIWDDGKQELFCARDRIGIKPFYYYLTDEFFLFASDIKTVIASGLYVPEPEWEGIYHALSLSCAPRPMTCFKGVRALDQAHWLAIRPSDGRIRKSCYWRMPVGQVDFEKTDREWIEAFEQLLRRAVKRRLVADVPVGTFMSGGLDSTTISALASIMHPGIKAFTLVHGDATPDLDELPQAQATAAMYNMDHIIERSDPQDLLNRLDEIIRCYEEPFPSLGPTYVISRLAKKHATTVVLNGLGGDELLAGYSRERWLPLLGRLRAAAALATMLPLKNRLARLVRIMASRDIVEYYVNIFSPFGEKEKHRLFNKGMTETWDTSATLRRYYDIEPRRFSSPEEALSYMDMVHYIGNHHVYRSDQFTMRFSLEARFPFLDHELVELACRMPWSIKHKDGHGKYVLRKIAEKYIHSSCLNMPKKGFAMPMDLWMRSRLRPLINQKIREVKNRGIFDAQRIDELVNDFDSGKASHSKLWLLVTVELWLETFID